ncbi:MAG: hypothetical protein ACQERJ_03560, partial [Bacillota bacterium]
TESKENEKYSLLTEEEKISLKNDIHRINNDDLKKEILNGFGDEFLVKLYFNSNAVDNLVLNVYEFFSVLIKCDISYSSWFYKQDKDYNKLINLRGESNVRKITWEKKEVISGIQKK